MTKSDGKHLPNDPPHTYCPVTSHVSALGVRAPPPSRRKVFPSRRVGKLSARTKLRAPALTHRPLAPGLLFLEESSGLQTTWLSAGEAPRGLSQRLQGRRGATAAGSGLYSALVIRQKSRTLSPSPGWVPGNPRRCRPAGRKPGSQTQGTRRGREEGAQCWGEGWRAQNRWSPRGSAQGPVNSGAASEPTMAPSWVPERTIFCNTRSETLKHGPVHAHGSPGIKPRATPAYGQEGWRLQCVSQACGGDTWG